MFYHRKLKWYLLIAVVVINHGFLLSTTSASDSTIRYQNGVIEIIELPTHILAQLKDKSLNTKQWQEIFPVYTGTVIPKPENKSTILGAYRITDTNIQFKPQFPLTKGMSYSAQFSDSDTVSLTHTFTIPEESKKPTTTVTHIYPSADELPENLLKFYIHFSAPMSRGDVYQHIHLQKASGEKVAIPFLELEPELWDPTSQRLTLFFDPGRIKRGLRPHQDLGLALIPGQKYNLVISETIEDALGLPLIQSHTKSFTVHTADRTSPNYKTWRIKPPKAQTQHPVILHFSEPLDHALLHDLIDILDTNNKAISGTPQISNNETQWQFTPTQPWLPGTYQLRAQTILEDIAGNHLNRLFDVDMTALQKDDIQNAKYISLKFEIHP